MQGWGWGCEVSGVSRALTSARLFLQHGSGSPHSVPAPLTESWPSRCRCEFSRLRPRPFLCALGWEGVCLLSPGVDLPSSSISWPCRSPVRSVTFPASVCLSVNQAGGCLTSLPQVPASELYQEATLCALPYPGPAENKPPARDIFRHSLIK